MTSHAEPPGAQWSRNADALWHRSGDRFVVLGPQASEPLLLDGTAAVVWDALEQPASLDTLAASLASRYGAPVEVVRADVAPLLNQLQGTGALVTVE